MWWYRDQKKKVSGPAASAAGPAAASGREESLAASLAAALRGRPAVPDGLLAMSLLVDHGLRLADGSLCEPLSWQEAETAVLHALGAAGSTRLYNLFARDYGDGYSRREDLPAEQERALSALRAELLRPGLITALESVA